jgi:hypothetical protein
MSRTLLAEFESADALMRAVRAMRGHRVVDAYSPIPLEGLAEIPGERSGRVRVVMAFGGFGIAACAYALEFYSAVIDYPINSGGRPPHSWPAFMMFPFSVGILSAAVCGLIALLVLTGLPRLHHPLFDVPGFDRMSQDRFALEIALPEPADARRSLLAALERCGAVSIHEVAS